MNTMKEITLLKNHREKRILFLKKELILSESVAKRSGVMKERMEQVLLDEEKTKRKERNKDVQRW